MSTDGSALGYAELLRLATSGGLQELESTIVQIPSEQNGHHAVVLAGARTAKALFRAVGEAWRDALPPPLRSQVLTVAEMRAKTRALCEAVGMPQPLTISDTPPASDRQAQPAPDRPGTAAKSAHTDARPVQASATPEAAPAAAPRAAPAAPPAPAAAAAAAPNRPAETSAPSADDDEEDTPPEVAGAGQRTRAGATARAAGAARHMPAPPEGLGPDILARLLQMTRKKAVMEGGEISEEEAMRKLDSFFQRAFGHPLAEGTRMEGQRVVQRLASELARLSAERGDAAFVAS